MKVSVLMFSDIDECAKNLDNCHMYAKRTNTEGSFECTCKDGFKGDGIDCERKTNIHYK